MRTIINTSTLSRILLFLALTSVGGCAGAAPGASSTATASAPGLLNSDATNIVYPSDAGVLNVRSAEFGAKGDGVTDDTAAIQKALTQGLGSHRIVYLPDGVYLVSDTLRWQNAANTGNNSNGWGPFLQLQGQSRSKTIVRLKVDSAGFGDVDAPKAVIATGSSAGDGNKHYSSGEGNEAFENHLRDFTVETGQGNAGAIGIDFQASNTGALRHVSIRGAGFCGLALTRRDNGPALVKDVSVEGFDYGIRLYQEIAHFTLEDVYLKGQTTAGLWMRDGIVGARHLHSQNRVPVIQMAGVSLLALFDSDFSGGTGAAAIVAQGTEARLYVRNLKTTGYAASVRLRGQSQPPVLAEWSSDAPLGNSTGQLSLHLPIKETPEFYDPDPQHWTLVPPPSGDDDTKVIQAALDAGKATVFFRAGRYFLSDTLRVPAGVKRLQGTGSQLTIKSRLPDDKPMFRFADGHAGDLTILDRFECGAQGGVLVEHLDPRTLVMRDLIVFGASGYRNQSGAGPLFVEDVACGGWMFAPGTSAWGRQWNIEGDGNPKALNNGGTVWGLGLKHEGGTTIFETRNGGRSELWAGLAYSFGVDANTPAYVNTDGSLAVQTAGMTFMGANGFFDLLVKETQNGQTTEVRRAVLPARGGGAFLPLYVSTSTKTPLATSPTTQSRDQSMNLKTLAVTSALATASVVMPVTASPATTPPTQAQTAPRTYKAPQFFDGEETGKATGNPLEVGGQPMWAAMQIWPDDIFDIQNYKAMNWAGDTWRGAYEFGGQPNLKVTGGNIEITSRGAWGGDGTQTGSVGKTLYRRVMPFPLWFHLRFSGHCRALAKRG